MRYGTIGTVGVILTVVLWGCAETGQVTPVNSPGGKVTVGDHLERGNSYADRGMTREAEAEYIAAIAQNRADTRAYVNLAGLYISEGRDEEAENLLKRAIRVNPKEVRAYNLLGHIYYDRGSYNAARYYYGKAVAVDPNFYEGHWNLVATCFYLNRDDEAIEHCRRYVELAPESEAETIRRARAYIRGYRR